MREKKGREGGRHAAHARTHQFHIGIGESQRVSEQVGISSFIRGLLTALLRSRSRGGVCAKKGYIAYIDHLVGS